MSPDSIPPENRREDDLADSTPLLGSSRDDAHLKGESSLYSSLLLKIYVIVFCLNLGVQMLGFSQTQIFESIYCSQWYKQHPMDGLPGDGNIPESYCKIPPVQTKVSTLRGWLEFFNAAPALIMSIPIGILSDRIGRRILLLSNLVVFCINQAWTTFVTWFGGQIPLEAVWFGASLYLLTGGTIVLEMLYVCVLTDISPPNKVAESFFCVAGFAQVSKVVGPVIAGALMRIDPWLAVYCALTCYMIALLLAMTIPETLHSRAPSQDDPIEPESLPATEQQPQRLLALRRLMKVWSDWRLVFVALTYPFRLVCYALSDLLQRYVSDRYGWTLANATFIYSLQAIVAGVVLFSLLPFISSQMDRRFSISILQKNVVLSRVALLSLVIAYALVGLAPTPAIMIIGLLIETLSSGFPATLRAIATALINDDDRGRVFSVLAISETFSIMLAYPVTAALFNIGIEKGGGPWLGLPYDVISAAAAVGFIAMCLLRFERPMRP